MKGTMTAWRAHNIDSFYLRSLHVRIAMHAVNEALKQAYEEGKLAELEIQ